MWRLGRYLWTGLAALPLLCAPLIAQASIPRQIADAIGGCACEADRDALGTFAREIATAATVEEARQLASEPLLAAQSAVSRAAWLVPWSEALTAAQQRLADRQASIARATTPEEVAHAFGGQTTAIRGVIGDVSTSNCHYSTGEIIAIVLGFIFGIIPGLILLILLC